MYSCKKILSVAKMAKTVYETDNCLALRARQNTAQLVKIYTLVPEAFFYTIFFIRKFATRSADRSAEPERKENLWSRALRISLDSCQRCHFLLTNHKRGSDLQFVDRAGWVSSPVLINKLLRRERRGAFAVFTSCQNHTRASRKSCHEESLL